MSSNKQPPQTQRSLPAVLNNQSIDQQIDQSIDVAQPSSTFERRSTMPESNGKKKLRSRARPPKMKSLSIAVAYKTSQEEAQIDIDQTLSKIAETEVGMEPISEPVLNEERRKMSAQKQATEQLLRKMSKPQPLELRPEAQGGLLAPLVEEECKTSSTWDVQNEEAKPPTPSFTVPKGLPNEHVISVEDLERKYATNRSSGLSLEMVAKLQKRDGPNVLTPVKTTPRWLLYIKELFAGFGLILWIAAFLCLIAYQPLGGQNANIFNLILAVILVIIIVIQSTFSFIQQQRATNLMESFSNLMPSFCFVLRSGEWKRLNADQLVVGDIVRLSEGDKVPADIRVLDVNQGKLEKSSLTGESEAVPLTTEPTDINMYETRNLALFGTSMAEGTATGLVISTGDCTVMGRLARQAAGTKAIQTSLHMEISYFVKIVVGIAILTCVVVLVGYYAGIVKAHPNFMSTADLVTSLIGVMVALIPQGLGISLTTALTLVAKKMYANNILVKKLAVIETLGSATVIATDKTGTLTTNQMTLKHLWTSVDAGEVSSRSVIEPLSVTNLVHDDATPQRTMLAEAPEDSELIGCVKVEALSRKINNAAITFLIQAMTLCNKSEFQAGSDDDYADEASAKYMNTRGRRPVGNPTEAALLTAADELLEIDQLRCALPLRGEIPFNSRRKFHLTAHCVADSDPLSRSLDAIRGTGAGADSDPQGTTLILVKGAPEYLTGMCSRIVSCNEVKKFDTLQQYIVLNANEQLAQKGERVLGFAFAISNKCSAQVELDLKDEDALTSDLCFLGLAGIVDPPRNGVAEAINECHEAGIRVFMVTGDQPTTAVAIARFVNIVTERQVKTVEDIRYENKYARKLTETKSSRISSTTEASATTEARKTAVGRPGESPLSTTVIIPGQAENQQNAADSNNNTNILNDSINDSLHGTTNGTINAPGCSEAAQNRIVRPQRSMGNKNASRAVLVTGKEIPSLTDTEWSQILSFREIVFSRTTPEQKLKIVKQLQQRKEVVAVTGDGVNDAPALKAANIGIAMGICGSDVSKEAANMVLLNDNFVTIVEGIKEGRLIFDNLKKVICYLLPAGTFCEVLSVLGAIFFGLPQPLSPFLMIAISIATDVCGSMGMVSEEAELNLMKRPPRNPKRDRLGDFRLFLHTYGFIGLVQALIAFFMYFLTMWLEAGIPPNRLLFAYEQWNYPWYLGLSKDQQDHLVNKASTAFFVALVMTQVWNLLTSRTRFQSILKQRFRCQLLYYILAEIIIVLQVVYWPVCNNYLQTVEMDYYHFLIPAAMGFSVLCVDEVRKLWIRTHPKGLLRKLAW